MHALAAGLLLLGALAPEAAPREAGNRVALLPIEGDERLHVRLAAELRAQRFEVVEVGAAPRADGAPLSPERELEAALRATGAHAAVRVESAPELVRVWIANDLTGKQIFREVAPEEHAPLDRAIVAMWAVELLRASAFAPRVQLVAAATPAPAAPPPVGVALEVAPALAFSPGGLGASFHLMLGVRWQLGAHGGVEALALAPTVPLRLEGMGGAATISMGLLALGGFVSAGSARTLLSAQASVGAALLAMRATGDAVDAFQGQTDTVVSGGPYLRAGAALHATDWLRLRFDALGGVMLPRPVVQFADAQVAYWGRPWTAVVLGAEAAF